jgi:hypothetical protein
MGLIARLLSVLLLSTIGRCQLSSPSYDFQGKVEPCILLTSPAPCRSVFATHGSYPHLSKLLDFGGARLEASSRAAADSATYPVDHSASFLAAAPKQKQGFHWGRALLESFLFLSIEQAYVVHDDYRWVVVDKGVPFNHYWRDYKQSLSTWLHAGWNDGDPGLYSYVGHPVQGVLTSYIQIQNDPQGEKLEFSKTKAYWRSRLKATLWNAVYSTQWNIGPLSELTIEKYGTKTRPPWNENGTWPCTSRHCFTGVGQVDLVMTPVGGLGWLLGEDWLDSTVVRKVEGSTRNRFLVNATRCALNPIRGGANILHGKRPWYRASREAKEVYLSNQMKKMNLLTR